VGHGVAVGAQGHRVRLEIYLSLVLREGLIHRQFIVMCSYGESKGALVHRGKMKANGTC
jgi:hypothetical protein